MSFKDPFAFKILTPIVDKAFEYLFNVVPSSKVSPKLNPWKRENNVLKEVPTLSALWRVAATTVDKALVAYS